MITGLLMGTRNIDIEDESLYFLPSSPRHSDIAFSALSPDECTLYFDFPLCLDQRNRRTSFCPYKMAGLPFIEIED